MDPNKYPRDPNLSHPAYIKAFSDSSQFSKDIPVGINDEKLTVAGDRILSAQLNIVILLLLQLHSKVDRVPQTKPDIDALTSAFGKWSLGQTSSQTPKKLRKITFATWKLENQAKGKAKE